MRLTVNGETMETGAETLKGLIEELNLEPEGVAAEVNMVVIRKKEYGNTRLSEGDSVEIVRFVGGG
jgi:thiamine biosynthesis protein ThiS